MGYCATAFAVDIQKVKDVFGSKSSEMLDKAKNTNMYRLYVAQFKNGVYDLCIEDIIFKYVAPSERKESKKFFGLLNSVEGSDLNNSLGSEYGYALMAICEVLGTYLTTEGDIFPLGSFTEETNEYLANKGFRITFNDLEQPQQLFDIPSVQTWPVIHSFSLEEVRYLYDELCKLNIDDDDEEYDAEILIHLRDKLKICIEKEVEWLSFVH